MDGTAAGSTPRFLEIAMAYTPANGGGWQKTEFVGSQSRKAWQAVQQAAAEQRARVTLRPGKIAGFGTENLSVSITRLPETAGRMIGGSVARHYRNGAAFRGETRRKCRRGFASRRDRSKHNARSGEAKAGDETSFSGDATVPLRAEWKRENLQFSTRMA